MIKKRIRKWVPYFGSEVIKLAFHLGSGSIRLVQIPKTVIESVFKFASGIEDTSAEIVA